jgi:UDP-N-acetyl-D-mannosaminuronic acid dehydrogenase
MTQTISVVGLGYIGLPLSLSFCEKGFKVYGVDINESLVEDLRAGRTAVHEMNGEETLETVLRRHLQSGAFIPSTRVEEAAPHVDTYVVTVGIPVSRDGQPNEGILASAATQISNVLKKNDLVLFRSTVVPGALEEHILPMLQNNTGLTAGKDFFFAYAAERVAEGRAMEEFRTLDIVLAGYTDACTEKAAALLGQLTSGTIHRTSLRIAQAVKVIENAQRDVNIALAQEVAKYAEYHGMDVFELIRMANTHPRVKLLEPGIGVGGFCIPNAFHYLNASLKPGQELPVFELARNINDQVPFRMVSRLSDKLEQNGKKLDGSTIAVLGLGMKDFSNDIRLSPALDVIQILESQGAIVQAYDPTVPVQLSYQVDSLDACLAKADGLIVATWQSAFDHMDWVKALQQADLCGAVIDIKHRLHPALLAQDVETVKH